MNNFNVIKPERNYGIDLLRIFAMFMVVVLHCLGQGGILNNATLNSVQYKFAWFMEILSLIILSKILLGFLHHPLFQFTY